jgi:hypothetical protein
VSKQKAAMNLLRKNNLNETLLIEGTELAINGRGFVQLGN